MLSENRWKVILIVVASVATAEPSRALSLAYGSPPGVPVFVPRSYRRRGRARVLFLDEDESRQPLGRGEIDLTDLPLKLDDGPDYEFTSPDEKGTERFYEPATRFRALAHPKYLHQNFGSPYAPNFGFTYPGQVPFAPPRAGLLAASSGWKARSPRVVFPYAPDSVNSVQTNSHTGPIADNVVFREQNFGASDVGAEEQLQDIGAPDAFAERDAKDLHRAHKKRTEYKVKKIESKPPYRLEKPMFVQTRTVKRNFFEYPNATEDVPAFKPISDAQMQKINEIIKDVIKPSDQGHRKGKAVDAQASSSDISVTQKKTDRQYEKKCPQGGTCEVFFYCWMVGGLLEGSCGGLLKGCCHRVAKAGILGVQDSNSLEYEGLNYGPVINDESCGVATGKQTAQRRIVGGDDAGFGTFPWQAYIRIGSSRCGGSLISRRHVVTAGHCVARAQPRHVRVTLGDYVINSAAEPLPAYTFGVRSIKVHPLFKFTPQADRFDVAVLTLDRNVHYMPHIAPICLPERGSEYLGQYGWAAGWGALSPGSRLRPRTLQAVDVPVLDNRVCERWHRANGINVVIYPEMLCAGYRGGGKDSCQGDSGGPLMLERAGRWYLIGVVSAGYSCASRGQPGIYHRVAHTVDWISHATTLS
ncbi:inactive serine protease scarface isoform X1 [Aricia agestis]|uniref:inactive serine protease scarface isoform X1 n=1 Tax=Aricia agestis TaxID=91739 RepID=UPI001C2035C1|nr:inactive serine protease scarface isoform X1 [Aricia agestis]